MPTMLEEINNAIAAHGKWKARLQMAIDSGKIDVTVATIQVDNQCAFGQWLYGATLTPDAKKSAHYQTIKDLHAKFHKAAGRVAELAIGGKKEDAKKLMAIDGEFAIVSGSLTRAMMDWKKALG